MNKYVVFMYLALSFVHSMSSTSISKHPIVVLIAFDGFRYDYLKRGLTPVLEELAKNGSKANFMFNQFPTLTFPNFHSISTGMYPETHGVLGNYAFDESLKCITYGYELFHYNKEIIPIWRLNELSGNKRYSGVMMWPGSPFKYQKRYAKFNYPFDTTVDWKRRVDTAFSWLMNTKTPANLVLMYFEQPDEDGHHYGPDSDEVNQQLRKINLLIEYYLKQLTNHGIREKVNTMIVSDHGMTSVSPKTVLDLHEFVDPNAFDACGTTPGIQIEPKKGLENEVYHNLTTAANKLKTFSVYKNADIPDRWHYKNNRRTSKIFIEAKLHYVFEDQKILKGTHGYDNGETEMHPIFMAEGPLFKQHFETEPFQNIDIYPLISHMLQLSHPPINVTPNGTLNNIVQILKGDK